MTAAAPSMAPDIRVPDDLTERDQWVLWRYETRKGKPKPTKVPYQINGALASSTDPATWTTYEEALAAWQAHPQQFSGIGFVFTKDDPYCGIDLDHALNRDGSLKTWAAKILPQFQGAYAEISPSGLGVKIWVRGKLPGPGKQVDIGHGQRVEMYGQGRFFAVTGRVYGDPMRTTITECQAKVDWLYNCLVRAQQRRKSGGTRNPGPEIFTEGARHNALLSETGRLAHHFGDDQDKTLEGVREFNRTRCRPPKDEEEIGKMVEWACEQERAHAQVKSVAELLADAGLDRLPEGAPSELVEQALLRIGFLYPQQIIWDKGRVVLTRTHYWYQHEPCWYLRKKNAPWFGEAGKNSTIWNCPSPKFIIGGSKEAKFDHPTQKPIELMRRPILNHTKRGELVYEPFLGSGTTLAAAELTQRVCFGLELDPKFADVVVQRWQNLTGKSATLEGDGSTFERVKSLRRLEIQGNRRKKHREAR